jgi:hypothetical protein
MGQAGAQPIEMIPVEDNWKNRRRVLFATLIWMGVAMTAILVRGIDNALYDQAFIALSGSGVTLLTAYIFGAVWDDNNRRNNYGSSSYDDNSYQSPAWRRSPIPEAPPTAEKPQPPPMP